MILSVAMSFQTDGTFEVRDALGEELGLVSDLRAAAYAEYEPRMPPAAWRQYSRSIANVWERLAGSDLIVVRQGNRLAGAITFYPDGRLGEGWPDGYSCIRLLAVPPEARNQGIARALMRECLRRSQVSGRRYVGLHTTEFMATARAMYERMGFERVPQFDFQPAPSVLVMAYRLELRRPS